LAFIVDIHVLEQGFHIACYITLLDRKLHKKRKETSLIEIAIGANRSFIIASGYSHTHSQIEIRPFSQAGRRY
jgi:hypothetical protein